MVELPLLFVSGHQHGKKTVQMPAALWPCGAAALPSPPIIVIFFQFGNNLPSLEQNGKAPPSLTHLQTAPFVSKAVSYKQTLRKGRSTWQPTIPGPTPTGTELAAPTSQEHGAAQIPSTQARGHAPAGYHLPEASMVLSSAHLQSSLQKCPAKSSWSHLGLGKRQ